MAVCAAMRTRPVFTPRASPTSGGQRPGPQLPVDQHPAPVSAGYLHRPARPAGDEAHAEHHRAPSSAHPATAISAAITGLDVAELLDRAAQRDPAAWKEILRRYHGV